MAFEGELILMSDTNAAKNRASHSSESSVAPRAADAERVALVASSMPDAGTITDLADVYSLLGEPNRVRLLIALLDGPMAVRDLAAVIKLSESAVSHALRLLRAHRVVDVRRVGRLAYYEIADRHVRSLLEMGLEHVGHSLLIHTTPASSDEPCDPPSEDNCR